MNHWRPAWSRWIRPESLTSISRLFWDWGHFFLVTIFVFSTIPYSYIIWAVWSGSSCCSLRIITIRLTFTSHVLCSIPIQNLYHTASKMYSRSWDKKKNMSSTTTLTRSNTYKRNIYRHGWKQNPPNFELKIRYMEDVYKLPQSCVSPKRLHHIETGRYRTNTESWKRTLLMIRRINLNSVAYKWFTFYHLSWSSSTSLYFIWVLNVFCIHVQCFINELLETFWSGCKPLRSKLYYDGVWHLADLSQFSIWNQCLSQSEYHTILNSTSDKFQNNSVIRYTSHES